MSTRSCMKALWSATASCSEVLSNYERSSSTHGFKNDSCTSKVNRADLFSIIVNFIITFNLRNGICSSLDVLVASDFFELRASTKVLHRGHSILCRPQFHRKGVCPRFFPSRKPPGESWSTISYSSEDEDDSSDSSHVSWV